MKDMSSNLFGGILLFVMHEIRLLVQSATRVGIRQFCSPCGI